MGFFESFTFILILCYGEIKPFSIKAIEEITRYYKFKLPYVKIKTESEKVKGLLKDIRDKSLVTVSENNGLKIVPWDKIVILKANQKIENKTIILDYNSK